MQTTSVTLKRGWPALIECQHDLGLSVEGLGVQQHLVAARVLLTSSHAGKRGRGLARLGHGLLHGGGVGHFHVARHSRVVQVGQETVHEGALALGVLGDQAAQVGQLLGVGLHRLALALLDVPVLGELVHLHDVWLEVRAQPDEGGLVAAALFGRQGVVVGARAGVQHVFEHVPPLVIGQRGGPTRVGEVAVEVVEALATARVAHLVLGVVLLAAAQLGGLQELQGAEQQLADLRCWGGVVAGVGEHGVVLVESGLWCRWCYTRCTHARRGLGQGALAAGAVLLAGAGVSLLLFTVAARALVGGVVPGLRAAGTTVGLEVVALVLVVVVAVGALQRPLANSSLAEAYPRGVIGGSSIITSTPPHGSAGTRVSRTHGGGAPVRAGAVGVLVLYRANFKVPMKGVLNGFPYGVDAGVALGVLGVHFLGVAVSDVDRDLVPDLKCVGRLLVQHVRLADSAL